MRPVNPPLSRGTDLLTSHSLQGLCARLLDDYDFECTTDELEYALTVMRGRYGEAMRKTYLDGFSFNSAAESIGISYKRLMEVIHFGIVLSIKYIQLYRVGDLVDAPFLDRNLVYILDTTKEGILRGAGFKTPGDIFRFLQCGGNLFQFKRIGAKFVDSLNEVFSGYGYPLSDFFMFPVSEYPRGDFSTFVATHKQRYRSLQVLHSKYNLYKAQLAARN